MNVVRVLIICAELFLVGLNIKLMVFSFSKKHFDALFAEVSYALFVLYAIWYQVHRLEVGPTWGTLVIVFAATLGILGLLGICKQLMETGSYTNGKMAETIINHTPIVRNRILERR